MIQQFSPLKSVIESNDDIAQKKVAVINNFLLNVDDATFEKIFTKIQKNPKALAKVKNYINFL